MPQVADETPTPADDGRVVQKNGSFIRPWKPGQSGNPLGTSLVRRRFDAMLRKQHQSLENMTEVFARLRALAMGEVVTVTNDDGSTSIQLQARPDFMRMYLDRVLGPVKADDQLEALVTKRLAEMLELAEREARRRDDAIDVDDERTKHDEDDPDEPRGL